MQPTLSVVTVVRNAEAVIEGCIQSVLAQNIVGLEYILIDGASSDKTLDIAQKYSNSITKIVSEPDLGLYDAMNKGLRYANGKFIHFLNADDRYYRDDTLKNLLPKLNPNAINYAKLLYVETNGEKKHLGAPFSWKTELRVSTIPQPTLFVAKDIYEQIGELNLSYKIAADYDMILRLVKHYPANYIDMPTTIMNAGGLSYRHMGQAFLEARNISIKHGRSTIGAYITYFIRMLKWKILQGFTFLNSHSLKAASLQK